MQFSNSVGSNSLKRWPQRLWCTDIWCISTYTLHNIKCTSTLSVQFEVASMYFLFYGPPCHIILLFSSHLVVRINYFCIVSSSTTQLLLNWLSINLSFDSILSSFKIFHTSIVVWLLRKFECRICIVTYLMPIYFSHPTQFNVYHYLPQFKFLFNSELIKG